MKTSRNYCERDMNRDKLEIGPLKEADVPKAASLLAEAFLDEPGAMAVIRSDRRRRLRILQRHHFNHVMLDLPQGSTWVALLDGEMAGVMVCSAPGKGNLNNAILFKFLLKMLFHVGPGIMWRGVKSSLDDEKHRPEAPNYFLETLGVSPEFQKRGIGAALLSHLIRLADRQNVSIYLCTSDPKTVPFYEKFGFEIRSETSPIGIPNFHMEREPKRP
jgi:GNAT superfamily N-acetyltransferase